VLLSKSRCIAHDQRTLKGNNRVTFPIRIQTPTDAMHYENIEPVKTTRAYIKRVLLPLGDGAYFTVGTADEKHGLFGLIIEDEN